uniref:PB1 domain-containing protein n=2 Tax=Aegilops tauschii TaxID=37682 RepID=A0A453H411_AEGTS
CGPDGAARYVGGETRVLAVPRGVSFRELAARLGEMAGGKIVSALRYRLADDEDVLVSVTCDEELAHLRDEYDRLQATRPSATFRVFF